MKKFMFIFFALISVSGWAQVNVNSSSVDYFDELEKEVVVKNWEVEAHLNSVSNSLSPTFGPSMYYRINPKHHIGARLLAPISGQEGGTVSMMAVYRYFFSESKVRFFPELTFGDNFYSANNVNSGTSVNETSVGTNLGIIYSVNEDFSIGGLAGAEWTHTRLSQYDTHREPDTMIVYGRFAIFANLIF